MGKPYIHFERAEFAERQARARAAIAEAGLDGLLLFKIEDMYWLTGHALFVASIWRSWDHENYRLPT